MCIYAYSERPRDEREIGKTLSDYANACQKEMGSWLWRHFGVGTLNSGAESNARQNVRREKSQPRSRSNERKRRKAVSGSENQRRCRENGGSRRHDRDDRCGNRDYLNHHAGWILAQSNMQVAFEAGRVAGAKEEAQWSWYATATGA